MATTHTITGADVQAMVLHWLRTPAYSYLGSDYGADLGSLLQRAQHDQRALDAFLRKLRKDVPVLQVLPESDIALYGRPGGVDRLLITLEVAGRSYDINSLGTIRDAYSR